MNLFWKNRPIEVGMRGFMRCPFCKEFGGTLSNFTVDEVTIKAHKSCVNKAMSKLKRKRLPWMRRLVAAWGDFSGQWTKLWLSI